MIVICGIRGAVIGELYYKRKENFWNIKTALFFLILGGIVILDLCVLNEAPYMANPRIKLINCTKEIIEAVLKGDEYLSKKLAIIVPKKWTAFGTVAFVYTLKELELNPDSQKWLSYLPILIESNTLIGSCSYKGFPDDDGMVEIGYEVGMDFRNKGYATEITRLLVTQAFKETEVKKIQAHTLAKENASVSVLKKCGFQFIKEFDEEEDGRIWKWELRK